MSFLGQFAKEAEAEKYRSLAIGPETDLKRWGQKAQRGGKNAKKRAAVAVARKLAVLLHRLWCDGSQYEPLRHSQAVARHEAIS